MKKLWTKPIALLLLVTMTFWLPVNVLAQNGGVTETLYGEGPMAVAILFSTWKGAVSPRWKPKPLPIVCVLS